MPAPAASPLPTSTAQQVSQAIIASLFTPGVHASTASESYISHIATWEDVPEQGAQAQQANRGAAPKRRYIILSVSPSGSVKIHKSKENSNGTFSIGKTWRIEEFGGVEIIDATSFLITLHGKTYTWHNDRQKEQEEWLTKLVRCHRQFRATGGGGREATVRGLRIEDDGRPAYEVPRPSASPAVGTSAGPTSSSLKIPKSPLPSSATSSNFGNIASPTPTRPNGFPSQLTGSSSSNRPGTSNSARNQDVGSAARSERDRRAMVSPAGSTNSQQPPRPNDSSATSSRPRPSNPPGQPTPALRLPGSSSTPSLDGSSTGRVTPRASPALTADSLASSPPPSMGKRTPTSSNASATAGAHGYPVSSANESPRNLGDRLANGASPRSRPPPIGPTSSNGSLEGTGRGSTKTPPPMTPTTPAAAAAAAASQGPPPSILLGKNKPNEQQEKPRVGIAAAPVVNRTKSPPLPDGGGPGTSPGVDTSNALAGRLAMRRERQGSTSTSNSVKGTIPPVPTLPPAAPRPSTPPQTKPPPSSAARSPSPVTSPPPSNSRAPETSTSGPTSGPKPSRLQQNRGGIIGKIEPETPFNRLNGTSAPGIEKASAGATTDGVSVSASADADREEALLEEDTILANVEEMLEGFEWTTTGGAGGDKGGKKGKGKGKGKGGTADMIERRMLGELKALEEASIYAVIESDDRVAAVIKDLDETLAELDRTDQMISLYKTQLLAVSDDIEHIEGQNRGLQVQTSNQRALLAEVDRLLSTIHIPDSELKILSQESMEKPDGVRKLENASANLYKALLSQRDTAVGDMMLASERLDDYRDRAMQFCNRISEFLGFMCKAQVATEQGVVEKKERGKAPRLPSHSKMEDYLTRYGGLLYFVRESDHQRYQKICATYYAAANDLHRKDVSDLLSGYRSLLQNTSEEDLDATFAPSNTQPNRSGTIRRPKSAHERRKEKERDGLSSQDALKEALDQIASLIDHERSFIIKFLHTDIPDDAAVRTFADYMNLETWFRREALANLAAQKGNFRDAKQGMDLVFGFLSVEIAAWIEDVLVKDSWQVIGVLAALDWAAQKCKKRKNEFLYAILQKQRQRSTGTLDKLGKEQIKAIEQTKLTLKKRKGVVPFIRVFPAFVERIEFQLVGMDDLPIRGLVDATYDKIIKSMFESLQQMAKMDGDASAEDKDQLNYHVILIENMHHFVTVVSALKAPALRPAVKRAKDLYDENLNLYIKVVLRRPVARQLDFFAGIEQLLQNTPPTEVSLHSTYTRSALKKVVNSLDAKDLKRATDALSKRVDKHFGDVSNPSAENAEAIRTVWKACEDEMVRLTRQWRGIIAKCYPDDQKVMLDFTVDDVASMFRKYQPEAAQPAGFA